MGRAAAQAVLLARVGRQRKRNGWASCLQGLCLYSECRSGLSPPPAGMLPSVHLFWAWNPRTDRYHFCLYGRVQQVFNRSLEVEQWSDVVS